MAARTPRMQLADQVAEELQNKIMNGEWKPGQKLPTEFELLEELNVGRGTIREAVKILVSRNILVIRRGNGTYVTEHPGLMDDPLGFSFCTDKRKLAQDLCEIRLFLEPNIASLAAERATEEDIAKIMSCCQAVEQAIYAGTSHRTEDILFHEAIAAASHNQVVANIVPIIHQGVSLFIIVTNSSLLEMTIRTHRQIADAIARHDGNAAYAVMREHLIHNRDRITAETDSLSAGSC